MASIDVVIADLITLVDSSVSALPTPSTFDAKRLNLIRLKADLLKAQSVSTSGSVTIAPTAGTMTDRSGTITTGGTAQQVMAASANRRYLFFQNVSEIDLWINYGATNAVANQPSIKVGPDGSMVLEGSSISGERVSVFGTTTGAAYTAKEI